MKADKTADLAGPGIGSYEELEKILPSDYRSLLDLKQTQRASMLTVVTLTTLGVNLLPMGRLERYSHALAGAATALLGIELLEGLQAGSSSADGRCPSCWGCQSSGVSLNGNNRR